MGKDNRKANYYLLGKELAANTEERDGCYSRPTRRPEGQQAMDLGS